MRNILYVFILLFAASPVLAQTNPFVIKPGFVIVPSPLPQMPVEVDCHEDHGWTDAGNGYQRHASGYYYHPAHGVYWPQPVQAAPIFQSIDFGGFAGACPPSG